MNREQPKKGIRILNDLGRNSIADEKIVVHQEPEKKTFVGSMSYIPTNPNKNSKGDHTVTPDPISQVFLKITDIERKISKLEEQQAIINKTNEKKPLK